MGKPKTCVDPRLYELQTTRAKIKLVDLNLSELVPALLNGESESTLLDVPDALIALEKWTGQIKVIGPVSNIQIMACAFAKDSVNFEMFSTNSSKNAEQTEPIMGL